MITHFGDEFITFDVVEGYNRYTHVSSYEECLQTPEMSGAQWTQKKKEFFRKYMTLTVYNCPPKYTINKDTEVDTAYNLLRQIAQEEILAGGLR